MKTLDKEVQTNTLKVFVCRREEMPLTDLRPQMNFDQHRVLKRVEIKVEEFILDRIGSLGIEVSSKKLENCYLRNIIFSPTLFEQKDGHLLCRFDHAGYLLSCYSGQRAVYRDFKRLVRSLFANQNRWVYPDPRGRPLRTPEKPRDLFIWDLVFNEI